MIQRIIGKGCRGFNVNMRRRCIARKSGIVLSHWSHMGFFYGEDSGEEIAEGVWDKGSCGSLGRSGGSVASMESNKLFSSLFSTVSIDPSMGEAGLDS
jgi:hypothetical protein